MKRVVGLILAIVMMIGIVEPVRAAEVTFTDTKGHWAEKQINDLTKRGIIDGMGNGKFVPQGLLKVDEFIKLCLTSIGVNFDTSKYSYWAEPYISYAIDNGLIGQKEFVNFKRAITREEMSSVLIKTYGKVETTFGSNLNTEIINTINDYSLINDFYKDAVLKCYNAGLMQGNKGKFNPKSTATRAEATTVIMRILDATYRTPFAFDAPYTTASYWDWTEDMGWQEFFVKVYAPKGVKGYAGEVVDIYNFMKTNEKKDKGYYDVKYNPYGNIFYTAFTPLEYAEYDALDETSKATNTNMDFSIEFAGFNKKNSTPFELHIYDYSKKMQYYLDEYGIFINKYFAIMFESEADYALNLFKTAVDTADSELKTYTINGRTVVINAGQFKVSEKLK